MLLRRLYLYHSIEDLRVKDVYWSTENRKLDLPGRHGLPIDRPEQAGWWK